MNAKEAARQAARQAAECILELDDELEHVIGGTKLERDLRREFEDECASNGAWICEVLLEVMEENERLKERDRMRDGDFLTLRDANHRLQDEARLRKEEDELS